MLAEIQFTSLAEFLAMGGYGFNVWSVYVIFAVFVIVNLLAPLHRRKQIVREFKRRESRQSQDVMDFDNLESCNRQEDLQGQLNESRDKAANLPGDRK